MTQRCLLVASVLTMLALASCETAKPPPAEQEEGNSLPVLQDSLLHPETSLAHQPARTVQALPQRPREDEGVVSAITTQPE